jgi:hypothetical protein
MAIKRRLGPPQTVTSLPMGLALYAASLSAAPSPSWRAAFLRPPATLVSAQYTPELGRVNLDGATVHFRFSPRQRRFWLRRIDHWIAYANSVV